MLNLSKKPLTKGEEETLKLGMNMAWPPNMTKKDEVALKIELERFFSDIKHSHIATEEKLDLVKTSLKDFHHKVVSKKPKIFKKQVNHIKNIKSLSKDTAIYISKFDKGNGVFINWRKPYLPLSPSIEKAK